jgi:hypothetical protein
LGYGLPEMAFLLPIRAPIIEAIIDSNNAPQSDINIRLSQESVSVIAAQVKNALIIRGTYQMLVGFCLTIKKQHMAFTKPHIRNTKAILVSASTLTQSSGIAKITTNPPSKAYNASAGDDSQNNFLFFRLGEAINNSFIFFHL